MKKTNKQEMELRAGFAADLLAKGHSCTVVTTQVTEEYKLSKRQARRITAMAIDLIVQDFEEINIERPQMVAKLIVTLEQGMQKGLINYQSSGVAACARQIIPLAGLAADSSYNNRVRKN
jgi:glycerol dehydrogenase-like iron-containing ADH family enzyme